jgi:hypothetical protein
VGRSVGIKPISGVAGFGLAVKPANDEQLFPKPDSIPQFKGSMTTGESDLPTLLNNINPVLRAEEYVFCTLPDKQWLVALPWVSMFREVEGVTVILRRKDADHHALSYTYVAAWITLNVHSSLEAVGFLAAIANKLATAGISCNAVSAFHHDHLFVPIAEGERALALLSE